MSERSDRIRLVIEECMARRDAGEIAPDSEIIAAHPELMPELERELRVLAVIERAVVTAKLPITPITQGRAGPGGGGASGGAGPVIEGLGDRLSGYSVVREIHRGGQGVVYEATQTATGRRVAIKVRRDGFYGDPHEVDRFRREVELMVLLDHPNIVGIIDSGVKRGHFFYVMDYVEGALLDEYVAEAKLDADQTMRLFEKIASAVNAAHLRGIIHRDLKPANVLVDSYGEPRLLDFGLARLTRTNREGSGSGSSSGSLTQTGQFIGSLPWTSPEQAEGAPSRVDLRTDVYSLGVILFQMLVGKLPYEVEADVESAAKTIGQARIPRVSELRKGVGTDVDTIVAKCLQKEPSIRYQSAGELAKDIRNWLERRPLSVRPSGAWAQFRDFVRRNKLLVALHAIVLAGLVTAVIWMWVYIANLPG